MNERNWGTCEKKVDMNQYEAYSEIKICEVLHSKVIYNYISILLVFLLQKGMRCDTCETRNERDKCGRSRRSKGSFRRAETLAELTLLHAKGEKPRKPREPCLSLHRLDTKKVRACKLWDAIGSRNLAISMDFISHCSVAQKSTKFLFEFVRFLPQPSQTQSWEFSSNCNPLPPYHPEMRWEKSRKRQNDQD